jgi:D-alanyl-lipoteichoic acid acyltransferase DltB (MBOAT superfamily)
VIELNQFPFWLVCGGAVVALVSVRSFSLRKAFLAGLNFTFLVLLLRWQSLGLAGAIVVVYLLLQLVDRPRYRVLMTALIGCCIGGLFVVHKLPQVAVHLGVGSVGRILAFVGYSYVALRMVELLRAVFERRHHAPGMASTINYLLPFHMLAAGPIQAYDDFVRHENDNIDPTPQDVLIGFERIASGLFKKFVLAYLIQTLFLTDLKVSGAYFLFEMQVTLVWLFLDFSAYSDIAVGVGILIGVSTPENFNRPLLARNLIEFWERWHISLSMFIRRNIFIPVQLWLMRRNDARTPLLSAIVAIAISFVLCGVWHGIGLGYLIWGTVQATGLIVARVYGHVLQSRLGKAGLKNYLDNPWLHAAAVLVTFEVQAIALAAVVLA